MINRTIWFTVGMGLIVFVLIGFSAGMDKSLPVVLHAFEENKGFLLLALACQFLSLVTVWLRWHYLTVMSGVKARPWDTFLISLAGGAINNLTPSARMGGEAVKMFLLNKRAEVRTGLSASTIVSEKVFDGIVFSAVSVMAIISAAGFLSGWVLGVSVLALGFAVFLLMVTLEIAYHKNKGERIVHWVIRKLGWLINRYRPLPMVRKHALESLEIFNKKTKGLLKMKRAWFYGLSFSALTWVFDILRGYFIFRALGLNVSLQVIALVLVLAMLVGSIPLLPGGLGSIEPVMIIIYTSSGISLAAAGMQTIIDRTLSFWLVTGLGILAAYRTGVKMVRENV